ncbi:hypothetical protein BASA83_004969 [Batrachochytrium salamandrivorans]|nr:hypothetical protein BASA81_004579 [Batrachochytrium salamandrivorans]KAH9272766.1 hypothetical protein BASA83_004969 [Batrachochytrium salamandrivorans]
MKLAIASTTILFAMMAAQAAVLSVAPATDVNLVKRTPNGDGDDEQSDMAGQSSSDPTSQFPMDDQSSSNQTPQLPLTRSERSQMRGLHVSLRSNMDELKKLIDTKQVEIEQAKTAITIFGSHPGEHSLCYNHQSPYLEEQGLDGCKNIRTAIAEVENELANLEAQLKELIQEHTGYVQTFRGLKKAVRGRDLGLLRSQYLHNQ